MAVHMLRKGQFERTLSEDHDRTLVVPWTGAKAGDDVPYVVYEYWHKAKPFYVG